MGSKVGGGKYIYIKSDKINAGHNKEPKRSDFNAVLPSSQLVEEWASLSSPFRGCPKAPRPTELSSVQFPGRTNLPSFPPSLRWISMAATHPRAGGCSTEPRPPPFPPPPAFNRSLFPSHFYAFFFLFPPFLFPLNPLLGSARGLGRRGERKKRGAKAKPKFVVGFFVVVVWPIFWGGGGTTTTTHVWTPPPMSISLRSGQVGQL